MFVHEEAAAADAAPTLPAPTPMSLFLARPGSSSDAADSFFFSKALALMAAGTISALDVTATKDGDSVSASAAADVWAKLSTAD